LAGDFKLMFAEHARHFDLAELLRIGVDRNQRRWSPLREKIDFMRQPELPIRHFMFTMPI
jgi:hypothetical protein